MMQRNIQKYLEREDKWFLSDGKSLLWAPPYDICNNIPGFWDKAYFYDWTISPFTTITILEDNKPLKLGSPSRRWMPSRLTLEFKARDLEINEVKTVFDSCLNSELEIVNRSLSARNMDIVVWNALPTEGSSLQSIGAPVVKEDRLEYTMTRKALDDFPDYSISVVTGSTEKLKSHSVNFSQTIMPYPVWEQTPFYDDFDGSLDNKIKTTGVDNIGIIYTALHYRISLKKGEGKTFRSISAVEAGMKQARKKYSSCAGLSDISAKSFKAWDDYFKSVPQFRCSDKYIDKYYWYRWYCLRLNRIEPDDNILKHPYISEGIGFFRKLISYSSPCAAMEAKWYNSPETAYGIFKNFLNNQLKNGKIPGICGKNFVKEESMYHANWGIAASEIYSKFKDKAFLETAYKLLSGYASYFMNERDPGNTGLYDVVNQVETGQEYSPRYLEADPGADDMEWSDRFRLKGVDSTVYIYSIKQFLAFAAGELGMKKEQSAWLYEAEKTKTAVLKYMWDENSAIFCDVISKTMKKSKVKSVVCFYPFLTDIPDETMRKALYDHLLDSEEFWSEWPVTTLSMKDEYFSPDAEWKGKRHLCPWNGRVWPMTESHVVELLFRCGLSDSKLRGKGVELTQKLIRMMFSDGDINRPNCYEHYNPETGRESFYRGVNDYIHSWINDLIIKFVCGIRFEPDKIVFNPVTEFNMDFFELDNLFWNGKEIAVTWNKEKKLYRITISGKTVYKSKTPSRFEVIC